MGTFKIKVGGQYIPIPRGAKGDTGDTGPTGPTGPQGAPGASGALIVQYTTTVPARPVSSQPVIWQGTVDPAANALPGDSWWPI
jgi:hypothetical protein